MSDFQVDLTNCDREPIHIPGQVQSHGYLIVLDLQYNVSHHSDNLSELFPESVSNFMGCSLEDIEKLIGGDYHLEFITNLISLGKINNSFEQINPFKIGISGKDYYLIISTAIDYFLLEFEPVISDLTTDVHTMMGNSISKMLSDRNLQSLLSNTVLQVRNTIHYDRVMVYRFAQDGHGEVVAENKKDELNPWLGLHYPASDIPQQARAMYKKNLTRLIADVHSTPVLISTIANHTQPIDLTNAQLRAVSPIHIQYLKNMGVASSFSISIVCKDELWGLIACHNYSRRFIDYKSRQSAKLLGQILSSALEFRQEEMYQNTQEIFKDNLDTLTKHLQQTISIGEALTKQSVTILDVVKASGAVLVYEKGIIKLGATPNDGQLAGLLDWIREYSAEPTFHLTNLSAVYPQAIDYCDVASGIMVAVISKELEEYVIFFKPELLQYITWAGNPEKQEKIDNDGIFKISPRNSFSEWSQTVRATSVGWRAEEISSLLRLKVEIIYAINQKAGAIRLLNEKLQAAYNELDAFSYTISHDLKHPIAAIKSYAQLLIRGKPFGEREQLFLEKIANKADQMNLMINAVLNYSRIGRSDFNYVPVDSKLLINEIVSDLALVYSDRKLNITVGKTPELRGDPTMIMQVFSNLIGNAVKYSNHKDTANVHVNGVVNERDTCYSIRDNGLGIADKDIHRVFELFNRMDNAKEIEGSGVGLAIVKRIIEKHRGRIWVESKLNVGTVFYVSFNN